MDKLEKYTDLEEWEMELLRFLWTKIKLNFGPGLEVHLGNKGIPQGSQISPHLFVVYIADLLEQLSGENLRHGCFVDDLRST